MSSDTTKIKKELRFEEVGGFLRGLADAFDGRDAPFEADTGSCLRDFAAFELKMKRETVIVSLKLKCEPESPSGGTGTAASEDFPEIIPGKPNYKKLKKEMQVTFKTIQKRLAENRMPDETSIRTFMQQAVLMISYPGHGDAYYGDFIQACQRVPEAFEHQDLVALQAVFNEIARLKNDCHHRFK